MPKPSASSTGELAVETSNAAPFIYFDYVPVHGVHYGSIQIELAARRMCPRQAGGVRVDVIETAHLRCTPAAARALREAIDAALKMFEQPQDTKASATGRPN